MRLIIVESPTKAKTISKYLDKNYKTISSFGHVRDLPKKELGVEVENNFKPKYIVPTKARKAVKALKDAARKSDLIILATDEDREGEAIAWHILEILNNKKIKDYQRIVFHEITKKAIEGALKNPRKLDLRLIDAQQARRVLDRLVGYELSPFLWKKLIKGLSAGRVQSVAVRLIVDREREIEKFKPDEYWSIEAILQKLANVDNEIIARLYKKDGKTIKKLEIKNESEAKKITEELEGAEYKIKDIQNKEIRKSPYPPFITSTLQQEASRKLGFPSKKTMIVAQQLYEGINLGEKGPTGLITYMRTDSTNLAQEALDKASAFIAENFGKSYLPALPRIFKTKNKSAQEAHEAIRPTSPKRMPEKIKNYLSAEQFKLYDLIWKRFVACQMSVAVLNSKTIDIAAKNYLFRANGLRIKFDGWLKVYPTKFKETYLPDLILNEILKLIKLTKEQHFTLPPARYNEASLVKTLEEYGIGRPSTYAPIISTIQARGYVVKNEQKAFIPTEVGFMVTDLLKENFAQIIDIQFTARLEQDLDKIAEGEKNWVEILNAFYQPFHENLVKKYKDVAKKNLDQSTDKKCPKCGKPMVIKLGRFGKFYACTGFPECKHTESIVKSTNVKCPLCFEGDIIERKTKKGKIFYSCSRYPECKFALWDKPTGETCPKCKSLLVMTKFKKIKCSNKECDYKSEPNK